MLLKNKHGGVLDTQVIHDACRNKDKITLIKELRAFSDYNMGLKEAKEAIESVYSYHDSNYDINSVIAVYERHAVKTINGEIVDQLPIAIQIQRDKVIQAINEAFKYSDKFTFPAIENIKYELENEGGLKAVLKTT